MSSEIPKNTVATIAAAINSKFSKLQINKNQVTVTSTRQEGDKVRAFFVINRVVGLSPQEAKRLSNPVVKTSLVMLDPFNGEEPVTTPLSTNAEFVAVSSITPSPVGEIEVGQTKQVTVSVLPANATDAGFTAVSSNPDILEVLNSGAALLGKGVGGNAIVTYTSTDGSNVVSTLQVRVVVPVVYPSAINPTFNKTNAKVGDVIEVTDANITPANTTDKSYTVVSSDPTVAVVANNKATVLKAGAFTLTVSSNSGTNKVEKAVNFTATDPNKDATYATKLSYKDAFGNDGDYAAQYVNKGDTVNALVKGVGLVEDQDITIRTQATGCTVTLENNKFTLAKDGTVVAPVTITNVSTTTATLLVEVLIGDKVVGSTTVNVNKTVVASNAALEALPETVEADGEILATATVNAKYTPKNVVWSATPATGVTITPDATTNDLMALVKFAADVAVGTEYVFTVNVDGTVLTSTTVTTTAAN